MRNYKHRQQKPPRNSVEAEQLRTQAIAAAELLKSHHRGRVVMLKVKELFASNAAGDLDIVMKESLLTVIFAATHNVRDKVIL